MPLHGPWKQAALMVWYHIRHRGGIPMYVYGDALRMIVKNHPVLGDPHITEHIGMYVLPIWCDLEDTYLLRDIR